MQSFAPLQRAQIRQKMLCQSPPLSTIVQPMEEICALAWQLLQQRIANPELPHQKATVEGKLLVRPSLSSAQRSRFPAKKTLRKIAPQKKLSKQV